MVSYVIRLFVGHTEWVEAFVIIFAERMSYPVFTQVETTHVRMSDEMDTKEVVNLTFVKLSRFPNVAYTWQFRIFTIRRYGLDHFIFPC